MTLVKFLKVPKGRKLWLKIERQELREIALLKRKRNDDLARGRRDCLAGYSTLDFSPLFNQFFVLYALIEETILYLVEQLVFVKNVDTIKMNSETFIKAGRIL